MGDHVTLSPMYGHYYSRVLTGTEKEGTSVWAVQRVFKYKGICKRELWPEEPEPQLTAKQIKLADLDAYPRRSAIYQRCLSIDDIKMCLLSIGPVMLSFMMYTSFYESYEDGKVHMPTSEDHWLGIHCVCILGYSDKS